MNPFDLAADPSNDVRNDRCVGPFGAPGGSGANGVASPALMGTLPMTAVARVRKPATRGRRLTASALTALTLAALAPAVARAAPVTTSPEFTASIPVTPTDWSPGFPPAVTNPVNIPKFDPSLGKLQSVNMRIDYSLQNDFSMTFTAPATITVGMTQAKITVDRPDKTVFATALPPDVSKSETVTGPPFPKDVNFLNVPSNGTSGPMTLTSAADLTLFTAGKKGETIGLPVFATAHSNFMSSTANGVGVVNTRAGANVVVSYTYAPVPEPTSLIVLGAGALFVFSVRRRRAA